MLAIVAASVASMVPKPAQHLLIGAITGAYLMIVTRGVLFLRAGFFCRAVCNGSDTRSEVALTYDDGPDSATTPKLLALLEEKHVAVTFFVIGERVRRAPELARRCLLAGHLVENHSDRHAWYTNFLCRAAMTREIAACNAAIVHATGLKPRYFRPPIGLSNPATGPAATAFGLTVVGWQVRGFDTRRCSPERVVRRILRRVKPGGIILLHDGGRHPSAVVEITSALLAGLAERGLKPVRLDRLLA